MYKDIEYEKGFGNDELNIIINRYIRHDIYQINK